MGAVQNYVGVSRRPPDIEDYIDMARRYRSWIIGPMFVGLVIAVVAAFLQPDTYVSYAIMRIQPQAVPEKLVPDVMNSVQLAERIDQMKTDILSRGTLSEIILKPSLNLYPKLQKKLPMEDLVQMMKTRDIHIVPLNSGDRRLASAFRIEFRYSDKYRASEVVRELVSRFTQQNVNAMRDQAKLTNTFLTDEANKAKENMDRLSAQITRYEMENRGRLPQQAQATAQALLQLQMQLMNVNNTITRDTADKLLMETQLTNLKNDQNYVSANLETVIPGNAPNSVRNEKLLNLSKQISQLKSNLASAKKVFGDNYPEISQRQAEIESLEADQTELEKQDRQMQAMVGGTAARTVVNPAMEKQLQDYKSQQATLQARMASTNMEIEELNRQKGELDKERLTYQKRLDEAPLNEQQYTAMLSDFTQAKARYQDFVLKQEQSTTSQNLQEHRGGENLELLDAANLPDKPVDPDRWVWAGGGAFIGLGLGVALAAAKEVKNTALKNLKDVRAYTNLPVLSSVPLLENALLVRRKRRLVWLAWSSALIFGVTLMGGAFYYYVSTT